MRKKPIVKFKGLVAMQEDVRAFDRAMKRHKKNGGKTQSFEEFKKDIEMK